ncbi:MAG: polysaccharide pyruvyl transferase family protein [Ruminococcus flavefaciens]|nr:polysaccharide pyruvyl transferase family protein [Ruminococcus flavefaciens]
MKVSVITLHTVNNYGSVLQTYATQKVLENLGCDVEFVDYWRKNQTEQARVEMLLESRTMKKFKPIWNINEFTKKTAVYILKCFVKQQKMPTKDFIRQNVNLTKKRYFSFEELIKNPPKADIYITGSDQVWNSIWNEGIEKPYFLEYAPKEKPRISFSASIGREELSLEEMEELKPLLKKYSAISMREESGVNLLADMGIKSEIILDPTLMIDYRQWKKIAVFNKKHTKPYLLIYQLNANPKMDKYAKELAALKNWNIIRIGYSHSDRKKGGRCVMSPSVNEFLGYFIHAECVLTDSFHATAFSLNFGKNFVTIAPPRFSTRIENILKLTGTENKLLTSYNDFQIADSVYDVKKVQKILNLERKKGYLFLKNALYKGNVNYERK